MTLSLCLALAPLFVPVLAQDLGTEFEVEMRVREAAWDLGRGGAIPTWADGGGWLEQRALLDAFGRAGVWAPAGAVQKAMEGRTELQAAALRVMADDGGWPSMETVQRAARQGLSSPFRALRIAALDRLAYLSMEPAADIHSWVAGALTHGDLDAEVREGLQSVSLKTPSGTVATPSGRRLGLLLSGQGDPVVDRFKEIIAVPLHREDVESLIWAFSRSAALPWVILVARMRDGVQWDHSLHFDGALPGDAVEEVTRALPSDAALTAPQRQELLALGLEFMERAVKRRYGPLDRDGSIALAVAMARGPELLHAARGLDEDGAVELWNLLDLARSWPAFEGDPSALLAWLGDERPRVREEVSRAVGRRFAHLERHSLESFVVSMLSDPDPTIRSLSFAWLAEFAALPVHSEERRHGLGRTLRRAWDREGFQPWIGGHDGPEARQLRWLAQLPRDVKLAPFRSALLGQLTREVAPPVMLRGHAEPVQGSLELLGLFEGDPEVRWRVRAALLRDVARLESAGSFMGRLPFDGRAALLARILFALDPGGAEGLLEDVLRRSMGPMHDPLPSRGDARPQLPKTAAGLLGRTRGGRRRLAGFLGSGVPRRVSYEAALQLLVRGEGEDDAIVAKAVSVLLGEFDGVDGALRLRAIRALGGPGVPRGSGPVANSVDAALRRLMLHGGDTTERHGAIDVLGTRGALGVLAEGLNDFLGEDYPDAARLDAAVEVARSLRILAGGPRSLAAAQFSVQRLLDLQQRLDRERGAEPTEEAAAALDGLSVVRAVLLETVAQGMGVRAQPTWAGGQLEEGARRWVLGSLLAGPLGEAEEAFERGLSGQRAPSVTFQWGAELRAIEALGSPELLAQVFGEERSWLRLDGRLLLALSVAVGNAGDVALARDLAEGATLALAGERTSSDLVRRMAESHWQRASYAGVTGQPAAAARSYGAIVALLRRGSLSPAVLRAALSPGHSAVPTLHVRYWEARAAALESASSGGSERARALAERWQKLVLDD